MDSRYLTGKHSPCPLCGGKDRWRFTDFNRGGCWICNQCGKGDGIELLKRFKDADFRSVAQMVESVIGGVRNEPPKVEPSEAELRKAIVDLWGRGMPVPLIGPVATFFAKRGIALPAFPLSLRQNGNMMLAKVISPDGVAINIHRTFLTSAGDKAAVDAPRKIMKGPWTPGSTVRLYPPRDGTIGLGEGLESTVSASLLFEVPVWSALTADHMAKFVPPEWATRLLIFGDNDANHHGQWAAESAARTAANRGLAVEVHIPPTSGEDWNDVLRAK